MAKRKAKKASGGWSIVSGKSKKGRPGSSRMLNPQPLPPQQKSQTKKEKEHQVTEQHFGRRFNADIGCHLAAGL
jgi:hypothetical protein